MPDKIKILPEHVINKIAAGEVVERPASVVKELVENSIDAGATEIFIDIEQAGRRLIRVTDNGCGMSREDARTAFLRHATSKIASDTDLDAIRTMGFRGEALSSIAAVSQARLLTARKGEPSGVMVSVEGGRIESVADAAAAHGTSLEISHLFYNTPARLKFLKSPATEFSHILTAVSRLAMAHASTRFKLTHGGKTALDLPASLSIRERTFQLYGAELAENLMEISGGRDGVHVHGLVGRPAYSRADRTYQDFSVNKRAVRNATLTHALYEAYGGMLMHGRHPAGFVFIELDPALVDVNVHPAKAEVRFRNQSQIHDLVRDVIREALRAQGMSPAAAETAAGEGVREAVAGYLGAMPLSGETTDPRYSPFFGRRKRDREMTLPQGDSRFPAQQELGVDLLSHPAIDTGRLLFPLAQVHDSFIIAQSRDGMAIVDQHAAHERVLFEKLQDLSGAGRGPVQDLLVPVQVGLGPAQSGLLAEYLPELEKLGFFVEDFGNGDFMIKAVPALLTGADYKQLLLDILDEVNVHGRSGNVDKLRDELLSVMACHPAIKVHRHLDQREMEQLLYDLFSCRMPHTCPHGRPTIVRFSI
ncbi:MAG TPA: DNA mismatch repair endonuclease MutL, partial [Nitrospirota bacterium]